MDSVLFAPKFAVMARGWNAQRVRLRVGCNGEFDKIAGAIAVEVRDEFICCVVFLVRPQILVDLIIRLDRWRAFKGGDGFRGCAFG